MKKMVSFLVISLLIFGSLALSAEEVKVPFKAIKSSCYGEIDMTKSEFPLSEVGEECVQDDWLEENLSEEEKVESTEGTSEAKEEEPGTTEELKENVERIFYEAMGETVNWGDNKGTLKEINLIKQYGYEEDIYLAKISYRINDNLTKGMIRGGMVGDAMDFAEKLFNNPQAFDIVECMLMPEFKMVDQYGNESEDQVAKIVVSRDLAEKINWDNMYRSRFLDLVEDEGQLWLHPAIRK